MTCRSSSTEKATILREAMVGAESSLSLMFLGKILEPPTSPNTWLISGLVMKSPFDPKTWLAVFM